MEQLEQYREKKQPLLDDMLRFITFQPNREQDIMSMMQNYLNAEPTDRPKILESLMQCVRDEDYPDPHLGSYPYTEADVVECGRILDSYIDRLIACREAGSTEKIPRCMEQVTKEINISFMKKQGSILSILGGGRNCAPSLRELRKQPVWSLRSSRAT
ncbi:hypothetical protein DSOL_3228 [Desulfosporosinus metallidurans]|uniref:Uncharacterized protein n=2 Tax=Desulfosporosinus metallidurans TaxID=1888891 RepID=A0A1Q8QS00_9FIRM|nr:hypothetical protein DSOL_3228 [Desulfosporosinus metallidurans]